MNNIACEGKYGNNICDDCGLRPILTKRGRIRQRALLYQIRNGVLGEKVKISSRTHPLDESETLYDITCDRGGIVPVATRYTNNRRITDSLRSIMKSRLNIIPRDDT